MSRLSYIKATAYQILPNKLQTVVRSYYDDKRMKHWQECFRVKISEEQVNELFAQMALNSDIMIHSSLPDIGHIKMRHIIACLE